MRSAASWRSDSRRQALPRRARRSRSPRSVRPPWPGASSPTTGCASRSACRSARRWTRPASPQRCEVSPATDVVLTWDAAGRALYDRPEDRLEARHLLHGHDRRVGRRRRRPGARRARPGRSSRPAPPIAARLDRVRGSRQGPGPDLDHVLGRLSTGPSTSPPPRPPSSSSRRSTGRSRPRRTPAGGRRSRSPRPSAPRAGHRLPGDDRRRRPRRRRGRHRPCRPRSRSGPPRARRSSASGRSQARPAIARGVACRSASPPGWTAPRPRRRSAPRSERRSWPGSSAGPRATRSSSSSRPPSCGYGAKVAMTVATTATDRDGTPLSAAKAATFTVEGQAQPGEPGNPDRSASATAGASGPASWHAVETYYLKLMNCTRGGGWVTSNGDCSSPGGSGIAPLILDPGSHQGLAAVRQVPGRRRGSAATSPTGTPATASAVQATAATTARTSAAARRPTRSRRSSARTSTSRARSRAAGTATTRT